MSTSICSKPLSLDRFISAPDLRPHNYKACNINPIRKALFGPVNHEETRSFLEKELSKIQTTESVKWNYDFKKEQTLSPNGSYIWRPATPQKMLRPIKRPSSPIVIADSDELYAQPRPVVLKPTPIRAQPVLLESRPQTKQRQITEFMSVRKSTTVAMKMPSSSFDTSSIIPAKKPKLNTS